MKKFFRAVYRLFDYFIIVPISRLVYNLQNHLRRNSNFIDKLLNREKFLIILSLILSVVVFLFVDSKAVSLVQNNAHIIEDVPVELKYNEEAYVIEGVPKTVDITITGRKSDIYLAEQLGEFKVTLDLSNYTASDTARKVYFTYNKNVNNITYKLDPSYVSVVIKNKISTVKTVSYELINQDKLDAKLSVKTVALSKSEVVVKGSQTTLDKIAWIKALVDLSSPDLKEAGTHDIDNVILVAYDNEGKILENVEIVPNTLDATVVLDSYSKSIPIEVKTSGKLIAGKSVASILINNQSEYALTVYGSEAELSKINSIPVVIDIDGEGSTNVKSVTYPLTNPTGARYMSASSVNISITFGEEQQKTVNISNITPTNLSGSLKANIISHDDIEVICKGVTSVLDKLDTSSISAYVDLTGLGVGDHEVEVKINNNNPMVTYVVSSKITVRITENN